MRQRLATDIRATSYWREGYKIAYLIAILLISAMTQMLWWALLVVAISAVCLYCLSLKNNRQPIHITQANEADFTSQWQLLYIGRHRNELWEAQLISIQNLGQCLHLKFIATHPLPQQKIVLIWQDQVTADVWRQLKVVANWT